MKLKVNQKEYWNNFYNNFKIKKPSNFARFFLKKIRRKSSIIADIGSGNGRDSFYFIKKKYTTISIDSCKKTIVENQKSNIGNFYLIDFCSKKIKNNIFLKRKKVHYIYARFFIHTINDYDEKIFFKNAIWFLKKKGQIFLEFRSTKDPLMNKGKKIGIYERLTSHYRRFINVDHFIKRARDNKLKIIYIKESNRFAVFKKDKPHICRIILSK